MFYFIICVQEYISINIYVVLYFCNIWVQLEYYMCYSSYYFSVMWISFDLSLFQMLPVSLECPFWIVTMIFSNVHFPLKMCTNVLLYAVLKYMCTNRYIYKYMLHLISDIRYLYCYLIQYVITNTNNIYYHLVLYKRKQVLGESLPEM
jgi:hypothetical protein